MDKLDAEIQAKLKEAEALRRKAEGAIAKAEQAEQEARILRRAAELRPGAGGQHAVPEEEEGDEEGDDGAPARRGGRQPGSISKKWREILADLAAANVAFDIKGLIKAAKVRNMDLEERAARQRVRRYVEQGFLDDITGEGLFYVTPEAIQRFGLPNENEATSA